MKQLPIRHMTLYKHGIGFYERRAHFEGDRIELSFRVEEMNDVLKSLTAIDWGKGQVLGIDYATPESKEERLEGCSIHLSDERSLQDLLVSLRGREVTLTLDQGEVITGVLVGLDHAPEKEPLGSGFVSILVEKTNQVKTFTLARLTGVDLVDEHGASDLRFFLDNSLSQEKYRQVDIRLTPGEHELSISYIAPAPTWRVSYRLVLDSQNDQKNALLFGWGIFDNRLEEDLNDVTLSLVAGMPISFVYDLYNPYTPSRPVVKEERRVVSGPLDFDATMEFSDEDMRGMPQETSVMRSMAAAPRRMAGKRISEAMLESTIANVITKDLGELFQYVIQTPVTVGRGKSAMVPILTNQLEFHKDLLYNSFKFTTHPIATLRLKNTTGLSLERGPVTVLENGDYVGEAIMPFTMMGNEIVVPYAVELGIKITDHMLSREEIRALNLQAGYLLVEFWDINTQVYKVNNTTAQSQVILVEHPRKPNYELFDSPDPKEITSEHYRFEINVPAFGETIQEIKERRLISRREEIRRQSLDNLAKFVRRGLLNENVYVKITELFALWEKVAELEKELGVLEKEREKIYKTQQQIQGNMAALGHTGREGDLRIRYVTDLETTEQKLLQIQEQETATHEEIHKAETQIQAKLQALN